MKLMTLVRLIDESRGKIISINLTEASADELCDSASGLYGPPFPTRDPTAMNPWWIGTIMGVRVFKEQPEA